MSQQGDYSGKYFGNYLGSTGSAAGALVGSVSISLTAQAAPSAVADLQGSVDIVVLLQGQLIQPEGPAVDVDEASPHGRIRRARHAADFQPDWLLEALRPPKPPRRTRKRRESELLILS